MLPLCFQCESQVMYAALNNDQQTEWIKRTIPPRFAGAGSSDFAPEVVKECYESASGLFLWGDVGTGKSHLMAVLAKLWIVEGLIISRINYETLLLKIRDTYTSENKSEWDVIQPYLVAQRLIIEDVGTTVSIGKRESDFSYRTFQIILNERDEQMLPTYITSNKSLEQIEHSFDQRVKSRIGRGLIINLTGDDKRLIGQ